MNFDGVPLIINFPSVFNLFFLPGDIQLEVRINFVLDVAFVDNVFDVEDRVGTDFNLSNNVDFWSAFNLLPLNLNFSIKVLILGPAILYVKDIIQDNFVFYKVVVNLNVEVVVLVDFIKIFCKNT